MILEEQYEEAKKMARFWHDLAQSYRADLEYNEIMYNYMVGEYRKALMNVEQARIEYTTERDLLGETP